MPPTPQSSHTDESHPKRHSKGDSRPVKIRSKVLGRRRVGDPVTVEFIFTRSKLNSQTSCLEWQKSTMSKPGYGYLRINGKNNYAHRLMWELTRGPIPSGNWVLHRCDNSTCINPEHLFLGSAADNSKDMVSKGRSRNIGGPRKLNVVQVMEIRGSFQSSSVLADRFGVTEGAIRGVRKGYAGRHRTWDWVK